MADRFLPRNIFHLILASLPPVVYGSGFLDRWEMAFALLGLLVLSLSIEGARLRNERINRIFIDWFGPLMKDREKTSPTAINHTLGSYLAVTALAEPDVATASMLFLSLGDPAGSFFGKRWGRPVIGTKSWVGAAANFSVCLAVGWAILPSPLERVIGAFSASAAELLSRRLDDNLTVPAVSAGAVSLVRMGLG
jgi:dolichol kinase